MNTAIQAIRIIQRCFLFIPVRINKMILKWKYRKKARFGRNTDLGSDVLFEGRNIISEGVSLTGHSSVGYGSYIGAYSKLCDAEIGRYTCISSYVSLVGGKHPTNNWVSIHPAFFSVQKQSGFTYVTEQKFEEHDYLDKDKTTKIRIGNDVWIGSHVLLLEGISIGDGAIIATGAVVVNDVPPYAIVGGCPARLIRYRFSHEQIQFLLERRWWDKNEPWIKAHVNLFESIQSFMEGIENEK